MLKGNGHIIRIWGYCDRILLLALFGLLGWGLWGNRDGEPVSGEGYDTRSSSSFQEPEREAAGSSFKKRQETVVNGIRVSTRQDQMRQIAQSLATEWDGIPASPAMDMRKRGKSYVVAFSLPGSVDKDSVSIKAAGHRLSVSLSFSEGRGRMQRMIHIPCPIEESQVSSLVTNGVLRVLIKP